MARLRPVLVIALTLLLVGAVFGGSAAAAKRHGHRTARCVKARHIHGKAGSFRVLIHRPAGHRRHACVKRRHARRHHASRRHVTRRHATRRHAARHHTTRHKAVRHRAVKPRSSAADGGCPDAELRPTREDLDRIRRATLCLVNRERTSRGEVALRADGHLEAAAQGHSESMAAGDYFEHFGPGGQTPLDRMRAAGYIYSSRIGFAIGENIAWATGSSATPEAIVAAWMASPGHRANILDGRFRDSAIGVAPQALASQAHGQPGGMYTQDFGVIIGA